MHSCLHSACLLLFAAQANSAPAAPPFRQFIEAEDCILTKLRDYGNPLGGYIGGRFAFNIFKKPEVARLSAPLASALPPGKVKVFVRIYCGDGRTGSRNLIARLGGASASLPFPPEGLAGKHNWLVLELMTKEPADRFELEFQVPESGRVIVDSILISTDPEDGTYLRKKRSRLLPRAQAAHEPAARKPGKGNLLVNSGFEVAPTNGWRSGYQSQWVVSDRLLDSAGPFEGKRCLRVDLLRNKRAPLAMLWQSYDGIYSAPIQVAKGQTYAVSISVKATGPVRGSLGFKGALRSFRVQKADEWQRVSATVKAPAKEAAFYITFMAGEARTVWLDAAQLEAGQLSNYSPGPAIDVGLFSGREGRVWNEKEDVNLTWEFRGNREDASGTLRYVLHDALGRVLEKKSLPLNLGAGESSQVALHRGPHRPGAFRVAYTVDQASGPSYSGQMCYSVIPAPHGLGGGPVGLYASHSEQCFEAMHNAGIHWTNTLSSAGHFAEWTYVEPEKGHFIFHDEDIVLARKYGIHILANINTNRNQMPKWAMHDRPGEGEWVKHPMGFFKLSDWEDFVFALVDHYRGYVKHWLIIDEPDTGTNRYAAEEYAKLLQAAYRAAKRADSDCTIIAHTGVSGGWREKVHSKAGPGFFDAQYTYIGRFNRKTGQVLHEEAERLHRPLWTVDFAPVRALSVPYGSIQPASSPAWDATAANTRKYDLWAVRSLSWGRAEKWFRYDARFPGPPPGTSYMSIWEHDGSLTPHGVSIAAMNALVADAAPQGQVELPEGLEGHLFAAGQRKLLIAWTNDGTVRQLKIPDASAWDVYGTRLKEVSVSSLPTFIEFQGNVKKWSAPVLESIEVQLLPPAGPGQPYRVRFHPALQNHAPGEWVAAGPYFLPRDIRRIPLDTTKTPDLILPLNVWPNLPIRKRMAEISLYLPGTVLQGQLAINTEKK